MRSVEYYAFLDLEATASPSSGKKFGVLELAIEVWKRERNSKTGKASMIKDSILDLSIKPELWWEFEKGDSVRLIYYNQACRKMSRNEGITEVVAMLQLETFLRKYVDTYDPETKLHLFVYNKGWDDAILERMFQRNKKGAAFHYFFHRPTVCLYNLAAYRFLSRIKSGAKMRLQDACKYFDIEVDINKLHKANYDCSLLPKLLHKIQGKGFIPE